ncbi:hypothetical protein DLH81_23450, partial [Vibrio parahaemolyticus]|nr:hypothetical protein [Vibrio parahaemolyticus]
VVFVLKCHAEALLLRASHLNWALVANEENVAKAECLGLMFVCFWACFRILIFSFWVCENRFGFLCGLFFVSEADLLVESQLGNTVRLKELFGVVSPFSPAF